MSPFEHLTITEILELWSLCCRSTRRAIIQHQKSGHPADHRLAVSFLSLLNKLKEEIAPLIPDQEDRTALEWDYATVVYLHTLLQPVRNTGHSTGSERDAFEVLVKAAMKSELSRIGRSLR